MVQMMLEYQQAAYPERLISYKSHICRQLPEYIEQIRVSLVDKCPAILVPLACEDRRRDETHLARSVLLQHGLEGVF